MPALKRPTAGVGLFALVFLAVSAAGAAAQAPDSVEALVAGRRSISLDVPSGGGETFGLWKMRSATLNRGLLVRFSASASGNSDPDQDTDTESIGFDVGPAFRRYLSRSTPIAPFLYTDIQVGASYTRSHTAASATNGAQAEGAVHGWDLRAGGSLGIGAEWFPVRRASIAGYTGARLTGDVGRGSVPSGRSATRWHVNLDTFTSAISLQIYF